MRRWIREGKLRARKIGTQHVIEEEDLEATISRPESLPLPDGWKRTRWGGPMPDAAALVRRSREGH